MPTILKHKLSGRSRAADQAQTRRICNNRLWRCILTLLCFGLLLPFSAPVSASTNDFYFDSYVADYYLQRDDAEGSRLHVKETLMAVFPDFDQNHGIERQIPILNQNGTNITVQSESALGLKVTRNGLPEPFSIQRYNNSYSIRIGSKDTYVHGVQEYTLEYDFTRVITPQTVNAKPIQELYWDTNGNGWSQRFYTLTANVHLDEGVKSTNYPGTDSPTSCYVGSYGESNQNHCTISTIEDGYSFTTKNLSAGENLTFDIAFANNTFMIPAKPKSYTLVIIFAVELFIIIVISVIIYSNLWLKVKDNYRWYKTAPIPPQYTPLKGYTAAQLATIYIKNTEDPKIATLLELTTAKKISLIKGKKHLLNNKHDWSVKINSLEGLSPEQSSLLELFNNGFTPTQGSTYKIKRPSLHSYALTASLKAYSKTTTRFAKNAGDFINTVEATWMNTVIMGVFAILSFGFPFITLIGANLLQYLNVRYYDVVAPWLILPICICLIIPPIAHIIITAKLSPYKKYTLQGLEHSNYAEGLKLYIRMAEKDRLAYLQSVEGADTSAEGIVKLYEKLLPYAALFGLEQSWLREMDNYYNVAQIERPDWYDSGITSALMLRDFSSSFNRLTSSSYSSSSSSSSSSSGGGGGGFSGGGGGGGGGGGW